MDTQYKNSGLVVCKCCFYDVYYLDACAILFGLIIREGCYALI